MTTTSATVASQLEIGLLVTMNETSFLHLAGGKVTLQARWAVNQNKKPANGKIVFFYFAFRMSLF
jgi:hypothetical protein